jgi:hypothetical protein
MATADTRSGFRLPWSQDRPHEEPAPETAAEPELSDGSEASADDVAWPDVDVHARLGMQTAQQRPADEAPATTAEGPEGNAMVESAAAHAMPSQAPAAPPRKPSKLVADLAAAMRQTAEAARDQQMTQLDTDARQVVEWIREKATSGVTELQQQCETDIAGIREWSKSEIARIKSETDTRITDRKASLESELEGHAAAIERRVGEVETTVASYETEMADFFERLLRENDPARLAAMAETMPEPPSLEAWADLDDLDITPIVATVAVAPADIEPEPVVESVESVEAADPSAAEPETLETGEAEAPDQAPGTDGEAGGWDDNDAAWTSEAATDGEPTDAPADTGDDVPRWAAGEAPEGFPTGSGDEAGDPVDRGAIMAALEAAAEAVVAAEAAADSAESAEAAAATAETAAELLSGRVDGHTEVDPEAAAALNARVDAGGFETTGFAERLQGLTAHGEGDADGEPKTTQVVVTGLVSVASIASFKRHLGRLAGVTAVAVASGPEGEFLFNVTHRPDVSFRDAIPTMPGFAARVTNTGDGTVQVTARDPEAES